MRFHLCTFNLHLHRTSDDNLHWLFNYESCLSSPSLEHSSCPETNVCEGERRWAVSASPQSLHRCHQQPDKQPAVCLFVCFGAFVCLRICLWFHAATSVSYSFAKHLRQHALPFSLSLLILAFQSRTCQTDHASSCTNFGRTVSPGWGRITRAQWLIRLENVFWNFTAEPRFSQHAELIHALFVVLFLGWEANSSLMLFNLLCSQLSAVTNQ